MFYAKSKPVETLSEHTNELLNQLLILKDGYRNLIDEYNFIEKDRFWELLEFISYIHDVGKCYVMFQNKIKMSIGEAPITTNFNMDVAHNYLSPSIINFKKLNIEDMGLQICVIHSVFYHHERGEIIDSDMIDKIKYAVKDLESNIDKIKEELNIEKGLNDKKLRLSYLNYVNKRISPSDKYYKLYIMLKGLLHRLDYSASAHIDIEANIDSNIGSVINEYFKNHGYSNNNIQNYALSKQNENLVVIGSTGIGKTEAALYWIGDSKAFFTLPLRVSINALYTRVVDAILDIGEDNFVGLLHSTSLDYLEDNYHNGIAIVDESKLLSKKLTFSTIDQLFKFPFLYRGYERIYSTLAYSKVVIDEIQAYSPDMAATIIKGLEMINNIGGKFMIMTATMPTIYTDQLIKRGVLPKDYKVEMFNTDKIRHHICIKDKSIDECCNNIAVEGKDNSVLVICNTVNSAIKRYAEIKRSLKKQGLDKEVKLLHSMYINGDRAKLEKEIKEFSDKGKKGIWITTQLAEASLDIDFDILHTDMSTLDSLFQRLGRCNRAGVKTHPLYPNVFIYTQEVEGIGSVYNKDIYDLSLEILRQNIKDGLISEEAKVEMVSELYSEDKIKHTSFYKRFNSTLNMLDSIGASEFSDKEAQRMLRDIKTTTVIPVSIFESIKDTLIFDYKMLLKELSTIKGGNDKNRINEIKLKLIELERLIMKKSLNIDNRKILSSNAYVERVDLGYNKTINIIHCDYDFDNGYGVGLILKSPEQFL